MMDEQEAEIRIGELSFPVPDAASPSVMALLHAAVEKGTSVETLEKLMGLYERVEDRRAATEFTAAMLKFHEQCPPIRKDGILPHLTRGGGKKTATFATLPQICRTVNPLLYPLGLSYKWDSALSEDGARLKVSACLTHVGGHSVTATFEAPVDKGPLGRSGEAVTSSAQDVAKVRTFGERLTLIQVLGIFTADEDTDAAPAGVITDQQMAGLEDLIQSVGADRARLLKLFHIEKLGDLPAASYDAAVVMLKAKKETR